MNVKIERNQIWVSRDKRRTKEFVIKNIGYNYVLVEYLPNKKVGVIREDRFYKYTFTGKKLDDRNAERWEQAGHYNLSKATPVY